MLTFFCEVLQEVLGKMGKSNFGVFIYFGFLVDKLQFCQYRYFFKFYEILFVEATGQI